MAGRKRNLEMSTIAMGEYRAMFLNELASLYPESRKFVHAAQEILNLYFLDCQETDQEGYFRESICRILSEFCISGTKSVEIGPKTTKMISSVNIKALEWLSLVKIPGSTNCDDWMLSAFIRKSCWEISRDESTEFNKWQTCVIIKVENPNFEGDGAIVSFDRGVRYITSKLVDPPSPPSLPRYIVGHGEKKYKSDCKLLIDQYMQDIEEYSKGQSEWYITTKDRPSLLKHLRWLIWRVKKGWSYDRIVEEESKMRGNADTPGKSAIQEAVAGPEGVAALLGVRLN